MSNGVIHSKASKSLALTKHPPYFEMVSDAIVTLKERNGSSQYAIGKFIQDKYKNLPANFKKRLLNQLKKLVASDKLVKVKASYNLPSTAKPKPKAAAKPKPAAKKALAKKKTAAEPKTGPAKPAAKAKLAPKAVKTVTKKAPAKKKPAKAKAGSAKATAKHNPTQKAMPAANNSNKPARQRKRSPGLITVEEISKHYGKSFEEAADILGVCRSKLMRICKGWPHTPNKSETVLIDKLGQPKTTLKNLVKPLTIKATYKEDIVRFPFILSDGLTKLKEQIATRFPLKLESFRLKYEDREGDTMTIACDDDLDLLVNDFDKPDGHIVIRLMVCLLVS